MSASAGSDSRPAMDKRTANRQGYAAVAVLSAAAGGLCVALATHAAPKVASGIASGVMAKMMTCMQDADCHPGAT